MAKGDYDSTIARIAGNIAAGMVHGNWDVPSVAKSSVDLARAIVNEVRERHVADLQAAAAAQSQGLNGNP